MLRSIRAVALAAVGAFLFGSVQANAADPTVTSLPLSAGGTTYNEAAFNDGAHWWLPHLCYGWTGSGVKPCAIDTNGYLGVNVFTLPSITFAAPQHVIVDSGGAGGGGAVTAVSGAFAAGAITDIGTGSSPGANTTNGILKALLTALGSPLQAGGSVVCSGCSGSGSSGTQTSLSATPTISTSAYSAGYDLGGLLTLTSFTGASGADTVQSIVITSKSAQTPPLDVVIFSANPSSTTFTDHAALSLATADAAKVAAVVHISDWTSLGTPAEGQAQSIAVPVKLASGTTGYATIVSQGTPTFASTSDVSITFNVIQQ